MSSALSASSATNSPAPSWAPFRLCPAGGKAPAPRAISTREGVGDRLRTAAFAELQAREAFRWAAERYADAPEGLRIAWKDIGASEDKHLGWILARMEALGLDPAERPVSDALWRSLTACADAASFVRWMKQAEERGREAERRFQQALAATDPETARMFGAIADEEDDHIAVADRFFP